MGITKSEILFKIQQAINEGELELGCSMEKLRQLTLYELKLYYTYYVANWWHEEPFYLRRDFYNIDIEALSDATDESIDSTICERAVLEQRHARRRSLTPWESSILEWINRN